MALDADAFRAFEGSRRRFRRYWRAVAPFSGLVRTALLRAIAREVTR